MNYVVQTSNGFLSYGSERPTLAQAQVFISKTQASTARDLAARNGRVDGTVVPQKDAIANAAVNVSTENAPIRAAAGF
jgi:hypothetical protein